MPASLKDLRARIKSVAGTKKITNAMKLVAAAKLGKAQQAVATARVYVSELSKFTGRLASYISDGYVPHPLMVTQPTSRNAIVVALSSDRGLCGAYNANVFKQAVKEVQELSKQGFKVHVVCSGRKVFQSFLSRERMLRSLSKSLEGITLTEQELENNPKFLLHEGGFIRVDMHADKPSHLTTQVLSDAVASLYTTGQLGKVVVVYNHFQSALTQMPKTKVLLPVFMDSGSPEESATTEPEPLFEPELEELLLEVVPRYMVSTLFQCFLEGIASEHGARMTAMDNATRNAETMVRKLQLQYQRARQAAITKELIEIISGAQAL